MGKMTQVVILTFILVLSSSHIGQITATDDEIPIFSLNIILRESDVGPDDLVDVDPRIDTVDRIINELGKIKIEVTKTLLTQEELEERLFYSPSLSNGEQSEIQTSATDGFDLSLIDIPIISKDFNFWEHGLTTSSNSPCPSSQLITQCNYYWYSNGAVEDLYSDVSNVRNDFSQYLTLIQKLQALLNEDVPSTVILDTLQPIYSHQNLGLTPNEALLIGYNAMQDGWASLGIFEDILKIGSVKRLDQNLVSPLARDFEGYFEEFSNSMVWQGLYDRASDLRITPLIAEQLPIWNNDFTVAQIKLRDNVFFKDGHRLDAQDVVATYDFLLNSSTNPYADSFYSQAQGLRFGGTSSVKEINSTTVRFEFQSRMDNRREFEFLSFGIIPSHKYGNLTDPTVSNMDYGTELLNNPDVLGFGTGPYFYSEFGGNQGTDILTASSDYWRGDVRYNTIEITRQIISFNQAFMLRNQSIDILIDGGLSPFDLTPGIDDDIVYHLVPGKVDLTYIDENRRSSMYELAFNQRHPIIGKGTGTPLGIENPELANLAAKNVRQAINSAIPRDDIINEIFRGLAKPGDTRISSRNFGFDPDLEIPFYNLSKSIALLREVGYDVPLLETDSESKSDDILDLPLFLGSGVIIILIVIMGSTVLVFRSRRRLRRYEKPVDYSKEYLEQARKMAEEDDFE